MTSASVRLDDHGRLEVVRRSPPEDRARLLATVDRLRRAAGTGAVDLVGVESADGELTVVLAHAGAPIAGPLPAADVARLGASVAATLADLHGRGMVHGAVRAEHVLRDAAGTPRVCGLGDGAGEPADDVAALGSLLRELLDPRQSTDAARDLRVQLDRCCVDDPLARPTASAIAAALAAAAPAARTIVRPTVAATQKTSAPRRVRLPSFSWRATARSVVLRHTYREAVAIGAAAIAAIGVGVGVGRWPSSARADASPRAAVATTSSSTTTARREASTTSITMKSVRARRVWPPAPPHVLHANGTWTFGTDDDRVVVGDWDCDGVGTPALLQPDGDLYVIDAWTDDAPARFVTTVDGGHDLQVEPNGDCDRLVIQTEDGRTITPSMDGS